MKQVYNNINLQNGGLNNGLYKILVAPKEWISNSVDIDYRTGAVKTEVNFVAGKNFIELELIPNSYILEEKNKSSRNGQYYEISIVGTINKLTVDVRQTLETLKHHQLICIAFDKNKSKKIIGNTDNAMHLSFGNKTPNNSIHTDISLMIECEETAPYYII
jgi:hypothetical protein